MHVHSSLCLLRKSQVTLKIFRVYVCVTSLLWFMRPSLVLPSIRYQCLREQGAQTKVTWGVLSRHERMIPNKKELTTVSWGEIASRPCKQPHLDFESPEWFPIDKLPLSCYETSPVHFLSPHRQFPSLRVLLFLTFPDCHIFGSVLRREVSSSRRTQWDLMNPMRKLLRGKNQIPIA